MLVLKLSRFLVVPLAVVSIFVSYVLSHDPNEVKNYDVWLRCFRVIMAVYGATLCLSLLDVLKTIFESESVVKVIEEHQNIISVVNVAICVTLIVVSIFLTTYMVFLPHIAVEDDLIFKHMCSAFYYVLLTSFILSVVAHYVCNFMGNNDTQHIFEVVSVVICVYFIYISTNILWYIRELQISCSN